MEETFEFYLPFILDIKDEEDLLSKLEDGKIMLKSLFWREDQWRNSFIYLLRVQILANVLRSCL